MDKQLDNFIEDKYYRLLDCKDLSYQRLYSKFSDIRVQSVFSTLHSQIFNSFQLMNRRLPSPKGDNHFWAEESRNLLWSIDLIYEIQQNFVNTEFAFNIEKKYDALFKKCLTFLESRWGSKLPADLPRITLPYNIALFIPIDTHVVRPHFSKDYIELKHLGEGSYAHVYLYHDPFYDHDFILKRAKKDLSDKECLRFKQEFDIMQKLKSPYIVEVYRYNSQPQEYIMEKMDYTLEAFIRANGQKISLKKKKGIISQIYKAFSYIHSKHLLHRDISPRNILIKEYNDGTLVVKIADFGLVHIPNSTLTTLNTEWKGYFNDPELRRTGFDHYETAHEIYALTCVTGFILTGKTNFSSISDKKIKDFLDKGMDSNKGNRYKSVAEMKSALDNI